MTAPAAAEMLARSGLTAREREVATLAVEKTNRGIAEALFLSEKTVEFHMSNILRKLGCRSRAGLAAWAVRAGLAEVTAHPPLPGR